MATLLNRSRLNALMDASGYDAILASRPSDVLYCSGMYSLSHWLIRGVEAYALVLRDPDLGVRLVTTIADADLFADQDPPVDRFVPYGMFYVDPPSPDRDVGALEAADQRLATLATMKPYDSALDALIAAVSDLPASVKRIAVDDASMPIRTVETMRRRIGDRVLVVDPDVILTTRMVKTPIERDRLIHAAHVTEDAMMVTFGQLREGMTEIEAKIIFETCVLEQGAQPRLFVIGFGEHSAYPNASPGERRLRGGDIVRFDVGCVYEHYWADLSRCAVLGTPSGRVDTYFAALVKGEDAAIKAVRPGRLARDVFEDTVSVVRESGIPQYRRQHVGHGIGVDIYDPPILSAVTDTMLEPGMLLDVETPFYELGFGGLQIEDLVLVTESGSELVTRTERRLYAIS